MQGLSVLYDYQGRVAEWARLVAEIAADYCTPDGDPVPDEEACGEPGRTEDYTLVMGYRVRLAWRYERDLPRAAALQEKQVAWDRRQAAAALALPPEAALDAVQRNRIRTLAVSLEELGHILREQGSPDCVAAYKETIRRCQRIQDTAEEAIAYHNLGHAYMQIPAIRDLDAAEAAYRRSLDLRDPNDALGRARCIKQIGMVHHARLDEARARGEAAALRHAQAAEDHYLKALGLCPPTALADLGPMHGQLGNLYREVGETEPAREHYAQAAQFFEQTGDRYRGGGVRFNLARMYVGAAGREVSPTRRRDLLERAGAYAAAALRDFQSYQGCAATEEARAQDLLALIQELLAALS